MERLQQVTLAAGLAAVLGGCAATDRFSAHYVEAKKAVGLGEESRPPTQMLLGLHRKLASLPDPTRADAQQAGLPGQVFLLAADGKPATATGDLVLTVSDHTPRPPGQPPRDTEKWHFTPDVIARLKVKDDRFGECYVLFLPWPAAWKDVTRVTVKGMYKSGDATLHAPEVSLNLDLGPGAMESWRQAPAFVPPPAEPKLSAPGPMIPISPQTPAPQPPAVPQPPALLPPPTPGPVTTPTGPVTIELPRR